MKKPVVLMILDGFGIGTNFGNAIRTANKPNMERIFSTNPTTLIAASGMDVGLPDGQMGNSEVGHTNMGAGRVVYQELTRITKAIKDGSVLKNEVLVKAMENAKGEGKALHLMGLMSPGGVHSHITHIYGIVEMAKKMGVKNVWLHAFLDGRDVPPSSAKDYVAECKAKLEEIGVGKIATVSGRYYAMDRDNNWDRVEKAYAALVYGEGVKENDAVEGIANSYANGVTDEFVIPFVCEENATINAGDSVIFCNFRPDRAREITRALVDPDFDGFERKSAPKDLTYVCMAEYDATMPNVLVAFPPQDVDPTLGKTIADLGLKQLRIAETEKYAHVTFFFNGGVEEPNVGEDRILIPSPKVATYDLQPEMSAPEVAEAVIDRINKDIYDLIVLNFANPDMVGHTGDFDAAVKAIEALDGLIGQIRDAIFEKDGQILLTADHGNADTMLDEKGEPVTKHSTSKVPLCHICKEPVPFKKPSGKLADIAPTILTLMGLEVPAGMEGDVLV